MNKYLLIFLMLFIVPLATAQVTLNGHTYADSVHITQDDIPFSASGASDRAYVIQDSLDIELGGGLTFTNCNQIAVLSEPGNKFTLRVDSSGGNGAAIQFTSCDDIYVNKLRLRATWNVVDTFYYGEEPHMIYLFNTVNSIIDSSYIYVCGYSFADPAQAAVYGLNCIFVTALQAPHMFDIINDSLILEGSGFERRDYFPQQVIKAIKSANDVSLTTGDRTDYSIRLAHNYIKSSWIGIDYSSAGPRDGVVVIDSNSFDLAWSNVSATPYLGSLFGDGGAIVLSGCDKAFIRYNTVRHIIDTTVTPKLRGGSGMFGGGLLNSGDLPANPRSEICYNDWHAGGYYASDHVACIFSKWGGFGDYDIHHNDFKTTIYNTDTNYTWGEVLWLWNLPGTKFWSNKLTMANYHSGTEGIGLYMRNVNSNEMPTFSFDSIFSTDWHMWLQGQSVGEDFQNVDFDDMYWSRIDTMTTLDDGGVGDWGLSPVGWGSLLNDVAFYDLRTDGNILDTVKEWWATYTNENSWIEWYRNFVVYGQDGNGVPINCSLAVINAYGDTVYHNVIGTDGSEEIPIKYWFSTAGVSDSTAFNDFTFIASYLGDTTTTGSVKVGTLDSTLTIVLGSSSGTPRKPIKGWWRN